MKYFASYLILRSKQEKQIKIENAENIDDPGILLDFIAGWIGGCSGVLVSHPLDTAKVHLQTQDARNPTYKGTFHCMKTLASTEGFGGLYRGITSPIVGIALINAIIFGIYGNVARRCSDPNALSTHGLAGAFAGLSQSFICNPIELSKIHLQLQHNDSKGPKYKGPLQFLVHVVKTNGIKGVMKGLGFTILRDMPGTASYFISYEYLMRQKWRSNNLYCLLAGGFAGCASWFITYPIDVVKSCIQADDLDHPIYKGYRDCIRKNYRINGIHFFFRGINSTMIRSFPMNAACFYVIGLIKYYSSIK